jgi:hypothetical protein
MQIILENTNFLSFIGLQNVQIVKKSKIRKEQQERQSANFSGSWTTLNGLALTSKGGSKKILKSAEKKAGNIIEIILNYVEKNLANTIKPH